MYHLYVRYLGDEVLPSDVSDAARKAIDITRASPPGAFLFTDVVKPDGMGGHYLVIGYSYGVAEPKGLNRFQMEAAIRWAERRGIPIIPLCEFEVTRTQIEKMCRRLKKWWSTSTFE